MDDRRLMLIVTSNAYIDNEREIVTQRALEGYVEQQWSGAAFVGQQPLLLWHGGESVGDIIFADTIGPWLVEVAREADPDRVVTLSLDGEPRLRATVRQVWDAIERSPDPWGASHGFLYRDGDKLGGDYWHIEKIETSVLPVDAAANRFTLCKIIRREI